MNFDERAIDGVFRHLDQSTSPGIAVGIAIGGVPVYRRGFGLANMELPVALSPHTRMRIFSTTKHFTCLAYLLFCEEGKAKIDDPISKYLPELHPVTHRVTMRQLMNNTSGLRDACEIRWLFSGMERMVPASGIVALYRDITDVNFSPGDTWCYNNGGFHILSSVIEKLADEPLEEVFRKRIFEPIGMHDSRLRRADTDFVTNSAAMHMIAAGGGYEKNYLPGELAGDGGIVSTIDDMLRWLKHMTRPTVGRPETWALMSASCTLHDGVETGYGFGLERYRYRGIDTIFHGGGGLGGNSQMLRVPEADLNVVAMANRHDVSAVGLVANILDICLGAKPSAPQVCPVDITGLFRSTETGRVIQLCARNRIQIAIIDGVEYQMAWREDSVLHQDSWSPWKRLLRLHGPAATPDSVRYECFGRSDELQSVPLMESASFERATGDYLADAIGVRLSVVAGERSGHMTTVGKFGSKTYRLERVGADLWRFRSADMIDWGGILASSSDRSAVSIRTWSPRQTVFRRLTK